MLVDVETTGLDISEHHIITIQVKDGYGTRVWCRRDYGTDSELIKQFVDYYLKVDDKTLIGYNIANFDLPLLFTKMEKKDLTRFFQKYNKGYVRDLAMILEFHKVKRRKLENMAKEIYGIDVTKIEDVEVKELYENNDWKGIKTYAENELDIMWKLFEEMWSQIKKNGHLTVKID